MTDNQDNNFLKLERLNRVMYAERLTDGIELAKALNYSQGYISEILSEKKRVPKTMGQRLEDQLNINRKWFETGEGEMYTPTEERNTHKAYDIGRKNETDNHIPPIDQRERKYEKYENKGAPYYENIPASIGLEYLIDNRDHKASSFIKVPGVNVDGYINVFDDSMYPKYNSGEIIGVKAIEKELVFFGHAYVLLMTDGETYIKYIKDGNDENHWKLESENEKYQPKQFHLSKIHKIFKIKAKVSRVAL